MVKNLARLLYYSVSSIRHRLQLGRRLRGGPFRISPRTKMRVYGAGSLHVGALTVFESDIRITAKSRMRVGKGSYIGPGAVITAYAPVTIGSSVRLGERVSLHTENHGSHEERDVYTASPIVIEDDVWLGANVVVVGGVTIGRGATVGANAVVTKSLPAGGTYVGVPAKPVPVSAPDPASLRIASESPITEASMSCD